MMGRSFSASEEISYHPDVLVLSYAIWQRSFGGDRNVVGKTAHIGGVQHTIIGVMPRDFEYPVYGDRAEVWVPLERKTLTPAPNDPYGPPFTPLVRLHAGVRPEAVAAAIANVHAQFVKRGEQKRIRLVRLHELLVGGVQPALFALEIAVGLVWLI